MKAIRLEGDWGLENLQLAELPEPEPGPNDVKSERPSRRAGWFDQFIGWGNAD